MKLDATGDTATRWELYWTTYGTAHSTTVEKTRSTTYGATVKKTRSTTYGKTVEFLKDQS